MQEEIGKIFAERLTSALAERNLPKKKIAELAGIHPVTLSKYLSGNRVPASQELHNLASVLHVTSSWLIGQSEESKPANLDAVLAMRQTPMLREDAATYSTPALEHTRAYREILLKLVPKMNDPDLLEMAETLQSNKPPGYVLILDEVLPMLRERIPKP